MKYKISEIAKLLNLSSQTLRSYEELGIVVPEKKSGSSYRYYGGMDIIRLSTCRHYRAFDFSLDDTSDLLHPQNYPEMLKAIKSQQVSLQEKIKRQQDMLTAIQAWRKETERIYAELDTFHVGYNVDTWLLPYQQNDSLIQDENRLSEVSHWLNQIPYVYHCLRTNMLASQKRNEYTVNLAMAQIGMESLKLQYSEQLYHLSPRKCLITAFVIDEKALESRRPFKLVEDYASQNDIALTGECFCSLAMAWEKEGNLQSLVECYAQIEEESLTNNR